MPTKGRPCCRAARPTTPAASRSPSPSTTSPARTSHPTATCWLACSRRAPTPRSSRSPTSTSTAAWKAARTILGGSPVVEIDAAVHPVGAEGVSPSVNFVDGYQYCDFTYESYGWEDTGLGARPYTSVGRIYTGPNTAMEVRRLQRQPAPQRGLRLRRWVVVPGRDHPEPRHQRRLVDPLRDQPERRPASRDPVPAPPALLPEPQHGHQAVSERWGVLPVPAHGRHRRCR